MLFTETPTEPKPPSATEPPPSEQQPVRVLAGRHGEWDTHELIRLLDTIEDERARGRFRESLYISFFVWLAIAWFIFYGPRYLWHAPELRDPASVLRERELTELRMPAVPHVPTPPVQPTHIDSKTMKNLRESAPQPAPAPVAPQPAAATPTPPPPPPVTTNAARVPPPIVADAPIAQPSSGRTPLATSSLPQSPGAGSQQSGSSFNVGAGRPGPQKFGGVDIISDTQGVDFDPYLRRLLGDIKRNWEPLLPPEAGSPLFKQGETYIRFTILPDGSIKSASMHLDGSTHDIAIDKSCWNAITSEGQYPPLPKNFHGPEFELRIHFLTNKQPAE